MINDLLEFLSSLKCLITRNRANGLKYCPFCQRKTRHTDDKLCHNHNREEAKLLGTEFGIKKSIELLELENEKLKQEWKGDWNL